MKLAIITAHAGSDSLQEATNSWVGAPLFWMPANPDVLAMRHETEPAVFIINGQSGMLQAYEFAYRHVPQADIIAFLHDDLIINDKDWVDRVLREFSDPQVGLVGFGGATRHGSPDIYQVPYDYHQLARGNFLSNMTDAENHGRRFTGSCDVAVLDGFALIVRREVLEGRGVPRSVAVGDTVTATRHDNFPNGWPLNTPIGYACYDYWLSCITRRLGYRIRLVGVACQHLGGRTFVKLGIGKDPKHWQQYLDSHRYIYDTFMDVLPYEVAQ